MGEFDPYKNVNTSSNVPRMKKLRQFEYEGHIVNVNEKEDGLVGVEELNNLAKASQYDKDFKPKRVLLVDFKTSAKMPENENYSFQNFFNLGLHRMEGYLKKYNVPVTVVCYSELESNPKRLAELMESHDVIGVSNLTGQVEKTYDFCKDIKKQFGDEKLVVGGGEHYLGYDRILIDKETTGIDACCIGQGELPMLALALGQPIEKIGSMAYRADEKNEVSIIKNKQFQRLIDEASPEKQGGFEILNTVQATPFSEQEVASPAMFNELNNLVGFKFDGTFATQAGSGCLYGCDFCPSKNFFGAKYESNIGVAKKEIEDFKKAHPHLKEVFMVFADAMLNPTEDHLGAVTKFMADTNKEDGPKIKWFAYLSAPRLKSGETIETWREKWGNILSGMAEAGCVMGAVGVEEIIYDRNKVHHKGQDMDMASEFIDLVGKHMLTRSLLILGAPEHFYLEKDKTLKGEEYLNSAYELDRDLIKGEIIEYMKKHPQALYRMNPWTLVYGTDNFYKFQDCLADDVSDPKKLKTLDHLHSVIDPEKMYAHIEKEKGIIISKEKRWVKDKEVWFELMEEIMEEYLASTEYISYIDELEKKYMSNSKLLYAIALKFKENALSQIKNNRKLRADGVN
jgi:hypothetical protein